jgi:predicted metal-dependent hydrolase
LSTGRSEPRFGPDQRPLNVVRMPAARRMRLSVDPRTGTIRLSLPKRTLLRAAYAWAEEQRPWIESQLVKLPASAPFVPGGTVPLGDEVLSIDWAADRPRTVRRDGDRLLVGGPLEAMPGRVQRWLQRQALDMLTDETRHFAARAGVTVGRIGIGDPRSRWGSCAADGDIRYSWRLILAPVFVRRATVAHEVAHRVHMNHGPAFHALVAQLLEADPAPARAWLKANGAALHWIGRGS